MALNTTCPECRSEVRVPEGHAGDSLSCAGCGSVVKLRLAEPTVIAPVRELPTRLGPYRLGRLLGRGAMGEVYEAVHEKLDRRVALKVLFASLAADGEFLRRFQREAESAARLQHPGIVYVYDFGQDQGFSYLAMQFVEGEDLKVALRKRRFTPREAALAIYHAARALQHAHEMSIIHRDIKPANLLLTKDRRVMVSDFGLARDTARSQMTIPGTVLGSPAYMSPEQARGGSADARSDVYSLGATLYELVTGSPPFRGEGFESIVAQVLTKDPEPPSRLEPKSPPDLDRICLKCLEKDPKRRYATAAELCLDLRRTLAGQGTPVSGSRWPAVRPPVLVGAGIAAGVLVVGLVAGAILLFRDRTPPPEKIVQKPTVAPDPIAEEGPPLVHRRPPRPLERPKPERRVEVKKDPKPEPKEDPKTEPKPEPKEEPKPDPKPELKPDLDTLQKEGDAASDAEAWDTAIAKFEEVLRRDSTRWQAELGIAWALTMRQKEGDLERAKPIYSKLVGAFPDERDVWMGQGGWYSVKQEWKLSAESFARAIRLDFSNPDAHIYMADAAMNLAWSRNDKRDWERIANGLTLAIRDAGKQWEFYSRRGVAYSALARPTDALADLKEAERLGAPDSPDLHQVKAKVLYDLKHYADAFKEADRALATKDFSDTELNLIRGITRVILEQPRGKGARAAEYEAAVADLTTALDAGSSAAGLLFRGHAYFGLAQWDKAIADYEAVLLADKKFEPQVREYLKKAKNEWRKQNPE